MKIVHVIETLALSSGGPAVCAASQAAAQALQGHDVSIVCYAGEEHPGALSVFAGYPGFERVHIVGVTAQGGGARLSANDANAALRMAISQADFVEIHGIWRPILGRAIAIALSCGVAYSITPHGMLDPWSLQQKALKKKLAWWLSWRRYCQGALFIKALNADEAELMGPLKLMSPIRVFPNGVFPEDYQRLPAPGRFYAKCAQLQGRRYVLFLSRLHFKKGLDYLVDAFAEIAAEIQDVDLVIAGPDDGARETVEADIKRHGLMERVHLVGPLYGEDKFAALVDAACFCLPSRQEGFSIAITEALACGTPVVISENCHFPEVGEVGAGRVVPLNAPAVAQGLRALLLNEEARLAAGCAGRELVLGRFSWHAIVRDVLACVESLRRASGRRVGG